MDIARLRLSSQQIERTSFKTPREIVGWMGAMQSQDYAMSKWAVGIRLPGCTDQDVEDALNRGEIIRTHVLRPTWHLVAAEDLRWMLALSAPRIKSAVKSYNTGLGLTEALVAKSSALLEQVLKNRSLTRAELAAEFQENGIATGENRLNQLLMLAELDGLICSGPIRAHHQTYTLLEERLPSAAKLDRDASLAALARRYFASHGPASLQDFAWWSGLSAGDAKKALEMVMGEFISETIDARIYWFANSSTDLPPESQPLHLLPGFDELIISYQDRSASLPPEARGKVITSNGIFRPVILRAGQVQGVWTKTTVKNRVVLTASLFKAPDQQSRSEIEKASARYAQFMNKPVELVYKPEG